MTQSRDTLREVRRTGRQFWEIAEFQKMPGNGTVGAHVFSAIIEDPSRFTHREQLIKYARLAITQQSSDGKSLGYQRRDRSGHRELKTLSYHAWRTATKSTTRENAVQGYYRASQERDSPTPAPTAQSQTASSSHTASGGGCRAARRRAFCCRWRGGARR